MSTRETLLLIKSKHDGDNVQHQWAGWLSDKLNSEVPLMFGFDDLKLAKERFEAGDQGPEAMPWAQVMANAQHVIEAQTDDLSIADRVMEGLTFELVDQRPGAEVSRSRQLPPPPGGFSDVARPTAASGFRFIDPTAPKLVENEAILRFEDVKSVLEGSVEVCSQESDNDTETWLFTRAGQFVRICGSYQDRFYVYGKESARDMIADMLEEGAAARFFGEPKPYPTLTDVIETLRIAERYLSAYVDRSNYEGNAPIVDHVRKVLAAVDHVYQGYGTLKIPVSLNVFDKKGEVVGSKSSDLSFEQISDIIDHAAQLIVIARSNGQVSDAVQARHELTDALAVADVIPGESADEQNCDGEGPSP